MKNTVSIALDEAKISALKMYLNMKNSSLDEELSRCAEQLYSRVVPQNVREFIDMAEKQRCGEKTKTSLPKPTRDP